MFPTSVVEGMLAAIGLLIIAKQLPLILGTKFHEHEFWGIVRETPSQFMHIDPKVFFVGTFCLALIFVLGSLKARWVKVVPPQVIAAVVGLVLARFLGLSGDRLIDIPANPFKHGIVTPDFKGLLSNQGLWWGVFITVLTLTLIDGVESLATIAAIDKIDPFRRKSDPNRTLNAMGVSNICSSMAGGLTIIPGGVKSTTAILSGARTQWANFYNATFLIIYLLLGRNLINMMPYSALGAIVLYTGYKLCAPKVWKHAAHIGGEQLFVFTTTVLVTVSTDLLWGIAAGIVTKLILEAVTVARTERGNPEGNDSPLTVAKRFLGGAGELFRDPVVQRSTDGDTYHMYFGGPMVCFNAIHLDRELALIPPQAKTFFMHITDLVTLIDHTTATTLLDFVENFKRSGRGIATIIGLDNLRAHAHAESSMRISAPVLAQDRAKALAELKQLSLSSIDAPVDSITYLERISLTRIAATAGQPEHPVNVAVIKTAKFFSKQGKAIARFGRDALTHEENFKPSDRDITSTSLSQHKEASTPPSELEKLSLSSGEHRRPESRDWVCLPEVAPVAPENEYLVNVAVSYGWKRLARMTRSLWSPESSPESPSSQQDPTPTSNTK